MLKSAYYPKVFNRGWGLALQWKDKDKTVFTPCRFREFGIFTLYLDPRERIEALVLISKFCGVGGKFGKVAEAHAMNVYFREARQRGVGVVCKDPNFRV